MRNYLLAIGGILLSALIGFNVDLSGLSAQTGDVNTHLNKADRGLVQI